MAITVDDEPSNSSDSIWIIITRRRYVAVFCSSSCVTRLCSHRHKYYDSRCRFSIVSIYYYTSRQECQLCWEAKYDDMVAAKLGRDMPNGIAKELAILICDFFPFIWIFQSKIGFQFQWDLAQFYNPRYRLCNVQMYSLHTVDKISVE